MVIERVTLRQLRRFIPASHCRLRQNHVGCHYRDIGKLKPSEKIAWFGCEDCLMNELARIDKLAFKKARLIEYVTWHYQSVVSRFHQGVHMEARDFLLWRMWLCRIGKVYFDEIEFITKAATEEIIDRWLKKEELRIDRDAGRKSERDFVPYDLVDAKGRKVAHE